LAEQGHSLLEAQFLINPIEKDVRVHLTKKIQDEIIRKQWEFLNFLPHRGFWE